MSTPQATNNPGTKNRGTPNRTKPSSKATTPVVPKEEQTIILKMPMELPKYSWEPVSGKYTYNIADRNIEVLNRLARHIGINVKTDSLPLSDDTSTEYNNCLYRIANALNDFKGRSNKKSVNLHFSLPKGYRWADIRRNRSLIYQVRVQNELQVKDEAKRLEDQRRDQEDEAREEAKDRAERAERERKRQIAEANIGRQTDTIIQQTKFWKKGTVFARAVLEAGVFDVSYRDWAGHKDANLAREYENSQEPRIEIHRELRNALYSLGKERLIYQIPKPKPSDVVGNRAIDDVNKATAPTPPPQPQAKLTINDCDKLYVVGTQAWIECNNNVIKRPAQQVHQKALQIAETGAAVVEAFDFTDPINAAGTLLSGGIFLTAKIAKAYNILRKAGKLSQVMRKINPKMVVQLERLTTKSGKIDTELLNRAWAYRISKAGSEEEAFFRNFMAAKVEVNGTVRYSEGLNVAKSAWHSENELQLLSRELRREFGPNANIRVVQIFTERIPCSNCMRFLDKEFPESQIFYAVNREADRADALFNYYYDTSRL